MPPIAPDTRNLVTSLRSTTCPACGNWKQPAQTLCRSDYARLPRQLKKDLYNRIGEGYEEAVSQALAELGAAEFLMPQGTK